MSKRRIYTRPITKISLHWISTIEIYAIFAAMGRCYFEIAAGWVR